MHFDIQNNHHKRFSHEKQDSSKNALIEKRININIQLYYKISLCCHISLSQINKLTYEQSFEHLHTCNWNLCSVLKAANQNLLHFTLLDHNPNYSYVQWVKLQTQNGCLKMGVSLMSSTGQTHDIKIGERSFGNVAQFKYLGKTAKTQNLIQEEIKRILYYFWQCLLQFSLEPFVFSSAV
jgi:hypothetical protein